jgi:hypothetical protein
MVNHHSNSRSANTVVLPGIHKALNEAPAATPTREPIPLITVHKARAEAHRHMVRKEHTHRDLVDLVDQRPIEASGLP